MLRKVLLSAVLLGTILTLAPAALAREYWAAMAVCPDCKSVSWSYRYPTPDAARRAAVDRVRANHSRAEVLMVTSLPYMVLARGPRGGYGYAARATRAEAIAAATENCLKYNSSVSSIHVVKNTD